MYHFEYVSKKKLAPVKREIIDLIHTVQNEVREEFTFQYVFIGSASENMVTFDPKSNIGYDFDIDLMVNDDDENYRPEEIKHILMNAFNKYAWEYGYGYCENRTRVFTVKVKDRENSKIVHSCDFAIVNNYGNNRQEYIRFARPNCYVWQERSSFNCLSEKIEFCKENNLWTDVRALYLDKKNNNTVKEKKSRSIFAETVHEICQRNGYYEE